jgi:tRNA threonylcarbamoyladenosine biosynthesis protein TsaB
MTPPRILAIDTSSEYASLALLRRGEAPVEVAAHSADGHAHGLFGYIEQLLARSGVCVREIDCFAAAAGPGSFTGVRVALSAAKGLAEANRKPMVAVSNLQALAWHGSRTLRAAVLDARRGEIYGAVYDSQLRLVQPETAGVLDAWLSALPSGEIELITMDRELLPATPGKPVIEAPRALASAVAFIALDRLERGLAVDPAATDANYVRHADAERQWRDLRS